MLESFQRLHHFDARPIFVPGAVAQIDEDIEAAAGQLNHLTHGFRFVDVGGLALMSFKMTNHV